MYQMTHPVLRSLHEDHQRTLALLGRFETLLRKTGDSRPPAAADAEAMHLLSEVLANMKDEIVNHFSFEEDELFPRFSRVAEPGIPTMLEGEHEAMRGLGRRMAELMPEAGDFEPAAWREFHRLGRELVEREVFHIQKEEMGFLPAMDQILDAEDAAHLAEVYAKRS